MQGIANRQYLTTDEAAQYLGLAPGTLQNWRGAGRGPPFIRLGGRIVYDPAHLDRWLRAQTVMPPLSGGISF